MTLDPRTRLWLYVAALTATLSTNASLTLAGLLTLGLLVVVARRALRRWLGTIRLLLPLLALLALTAVISGAPSDVLAPMLKLLALGTYSVAFFATITIEELGDAFLLLRLPPGISFMLVGSLRFSPLIAERWDGLLDARRARGAPVIRGLRGVPEYARLLLPLLLRVLRTADDLSEAMESRAFGEHAPTLLFSYSFYARDWAAITLTAAALVTYILLVPR